MAFLENLFRSDFTILLAVIFCLYNVVLATWGLGMMNNDCKNRTLFTNLRICLVSSGVMATLLVCIGSCESACGIKPNFGFLALFMFVWAVMNLASGIYIASNIADCTSSDVSIYKDCWYVSYVIQVAVVVSCIYYAFASYSKRTVAKAKERTRIVETQSSILAEERRREEEALAHEKRQAEETQKHQVEQSRIDAVRRQRDMLKKALPKSNTARKLEIAEQEAKAEALVKNTGLLSQLKARVEEQLKRASTNEKVSLLKTQARLESISDTQLEDPSFDIRSYYDTASSQRQRRQQFPYSYMRQQDEEY